jgi:hypothetical protein
MNNNRIKFGILVKPGDCNKHYLQENDRMKYLQKLDVFTYLHPFDQTGYSCTEGMIEDCIKGFKDDALWLKGHDSLAYHDSCFYLVCYLVDKDGKPRDMAIIRKLYYNN